MKDMSEKKKVEEVNNSFKTRLLISYNYMELMLNNTVRRIMY